jgi:hypothetical protein
MVGAGNLVSGLLSKREVNMNDEYRQQALDNFRNVLGRLEQSDFKLRFWQLEHGIGIYVEDVIFEPEDSFNLTTSSISNHTLRLAKKK